jgi:hypothetical protein
MSEGIALDSQPQSDGFVFADGGNLDGFSAAFRWRPTKLDFWGPLRRRAEKTAEKALN